jgi:hypothetical protein
MAGDGGGEHVPVEQASQQASGSPALLPARWRIG